MSRLKLPTLLCITENPSIRYWVKKHLDEEFFIIDASKPTAAIDVAQNTALDFIIVDSEMEECDPIKLCAEMKQILRTLVPVLLITGRLKKTYLDAAMEAGVTDFLNNQLDPEELHMRIRAIQKGHTLREKTQGASFALGKKKEEFSANSLKNKVMTQTNALKMIKEAKAEGVPIAALLVQLDRFDELRAHLGDLLSEQIILPLSNIMNKLITKNDLLIQKGEGRFIILLKNTKAETARPLAERLRTQIQRASFETKNGPIQLTISIVVSSLEESEQGLNQMVDSSLKILKKAHSAVNQIISIDSEVNE